MPYALPGIHPQERARDGAGAAPSRISRHRRACGPWDGKDGRAGEWQTGSSSAGQQQDLDRKPGDVIIACVHDNDDTPLRTQSPRSPRKVSFVKDSTPAKEAGEGVPAVSPCPDTQRHCSPTTSAAHQS